MGWGGDTLLIGWEGCHHQAWCSDCILSSRQSLLMHLSQGCWTKKRLVPVDDVWETLDPRRMRKRGKRRYLDCPFRKQSEWFQVQASWEETHNSSTRTGNDQVPVLYTAEKRLLKASNVKHRLAFLALTYNNVLSTKNTEDNQQGFKNKPDRQMSIRELNVSFIFFSVSKVKVSKLTYMKRVTPPPPPHTWELKAEGLISGFCCWLLEANTLSHGKYSSHLTLGGARAPGNTQPTMKGRLKCSQKGTDNWWGQGGCVPGLNTQDWTPLLGLKVPRGLKMGGPFSKKEEARRGVLQNLRLSALHMTTFPHFARGNGASET